MGRGGLGEGNYSGEDGQKHIHGNCICVVPGIINQIKETTDLAVKESLRIRLEQCAPPDVYQDIIGRYF